MEDMFDPQFYLDLVNAEYKNELQKTIQLADLGHHPRIVVRIEEYLKGTPLKSGTFSHYRPARYLAENVGVLSGKIDDASIARFGAAFSALNAIL
jgi:hypothetical protein